ncbi:hypothetical protein FrEUN1fDRAFT_7581 [Parafrankia sp. EUN1f]|nr:hypothetical protein FrEUN1fDRAFT_7581 [Parafrankia sp. EUN1f]
MIRVRAAAGAVCLAGAVALAGPTSPPQAPAPAVAVPVPPSPVPMVTICAVGILDCLFQPASAVAGPVVRL